MTSSSTPSLSRTAIAFGASWMPAPDLAELRRTLDHVHRLALAAQAQRGGQAGDAAADHERGTSIALLFSVI